MRRTRDFWPKGPDKSYGRYDGVREKDEGIHSHQGVENHHGCGGDFDGRCEGVEDYEDLADTFEPRNDGGEGGYEVLKELLRPPNDEFLVLSDPSGGLIDDALEFVSHKLEQADSYAVDGRSE